MEAGCCHTSVCVRAFGCCCGSIPAEVPPQHTTHKHIKAHKSTPAQNIGGSLAASASFLPPPGGSNGKGGDGKYMKGNKDMKSNKDSKKSKDMKSTAPKALPSMDPKKKSSSKGKDREGGAGAREPPTPFASVGPLVRKTAFPPPQPTPLPLPLPLPPILLPRRRQW